MKRRSELLEMDDPWAWLADAPDEAIALDEASLLIARDEYPQLAAAHYLTRLDEHAHRLAELMHAPVNRDEPLRRVAALNRYLFDEAGFVGEELDYYDPRNSYINEVLDRRRGIPISLSVIYLHLARSVNLAAEGVSFPGHFLVRLPVDDGILVLDPFHRGRSLGTEELRQRAWGVQTGERPDDEALIDMLEPTHNRGILVRMLRNLKSVYAEKEAWDKALRVADRLVVLNAEATDYRDRGLLYRAIGADNAAARDLSRFLQMDPETAAEDSARELLTELAARSHRVH